ncbi:VanZ family protein [Limosilactobacillus fermentum]|uniref:VanZ family protein n=1 Tax=Limosilactobacillus fermentum TaxID=1613 RepID=UPI003A5CE24E
MSEPKYGFKFLLLLFKVSTLRGIVRLIGFTIEFIQFITDNLAITHRCVDINDVLANTLGFVVGYYLSKLIDK